MKKISSIIILFLCSLIVYGQDASFGKVTITPYVSQDIYLDSKAEKLLIDKMNQAVTINGATGGFDRRFIITPSINVISENETATIPQKTSMKISTTFYIGDGETGSKFGSCSIETTGVGDSHDGALYSAIKKINVKDDDLQELIENGKERIITFYNSKAPTIIKEAKAYIASHDYEKALSQLSLIPSICAHYDKVLSLISTCGSKIIERDNNELLTKARAAWSANPNENGAREASGYLSQVIITNSTYKNEVENIAKQIRQRLAQIADRQIEIEQARILSSERLEAERINASSRVASSFLSSIPKLVYNIFSWF